MTPIILDPCFGSYYRDARWEIRRRMLRGFTRESRGERERSDGTTATPVPGGSSITFFEFENETDHDFLRIVFTITLK